MRFRCGWVAVLSILLMVGVAFSEQQTAKVVKVSGKVTVEPGHRTLKAGGIVSQGDTLTVPAGATLDLSFVDGATMSVMGPSTFRMRLISGAARTIDLYSGKINRMAAKAVPTGITTPYHTFVAAQDSTVFAGISESPDLNRVTYMLLEGKVAKVVDGRTLKEFTKDHPIVVDRPRQRTGPTGMAHMGGTATEFVIGHHKIRIQPAGGFTREQVRGGGLKLVRSKSGVGVVTIDDQTSFYLYKGQYIEFDAAGNVTGHDGIVHIYAPLNYRGIFDDPIEGPASASYTGTKAK